MDKVKQGKKNRAAGTRFELKVRKDLEDKGWIVSKWMNNVEFDYCKCGVITNTINHCLNCGKHYEFGATKMKAGKLIPAKHKFRGPGIPMAIGTGFPDFVCFKNNGIGMIAYDVYGVEVKSNGYLDKTEKEKCKWLLDNRIFSKILIAKKGKKRGEIEYNEFK